MVSHEKNDVFIHIQANPHAIAYDKEIKQNIKNLLTNNIYQNIVTSEIFKKIYLDIDDKIDRNTNIEEIIKLLGENFTKEIKQIVLKDKDQTILDTVGYSKSMKEYIYENTHKYIEKYQQDKISILKNQHNDAINLDGDMSREINQNISNHQKSLLVTILLYTTMLQECKEL